MEHENWRICIDNTRYEISDLGRVRIVNSHRILLASLSLNGYLYVHLANKTVTLHSLVAKAYCHKNRPGLIVDHINGDRFNNRYDNLRWVTHRENALNQHRIHPYDPRLYVYRKQRRMFENISQVFRNILN